MALSDQLSKLAARAKEAEDNAAAAKSKAKAQLEQDVKDAQTSAQAQADTISASLDKREDDVKDWWGGVQRSWNEHMNDVRKRFDEKKADHDLKSAEHKAT